MAILCLDIELEARASKGLHEFLEDEWALLFSHPQDFHSCGGCECHACEVLLRQMRSRRVRPLAVRRDRGRVQQTWVDVFDDSGDVPELVHLREPAFTAADPVSFGARALRGELLTRPEGFVLIVDESLRRRGVFKYTAGRSDVSTLDLLVSIDVLRGRTGIGLAA